MFSESLINALLKTATVEAKDNLIKMVIKNINKNFPYNDNKVNHFVEMLVDKSAVKNIGDVNLEYIKNNSKYEVITMRVNANNSSKYLTLEQKSHHTETELDNYDKFDYIIENNFDDTLEEKVKEVIERMI